MSDYTFTELQEQLDQAAADVQKHTEERNRLHGILINHDEAIITIRTPGAYEGTEYGVSELPSDAINSVLVAALEYEEMKAMDAWVTAYNVCNLAKLKIDAMKSRRIADGDNTYPLTLGAEEM